jgi:hypothetical protein
VTGSEEGVSTVDVIHNGERVATLELRPLPGYCPDCEEGVVPFWGVTAWELYPPLIRGADAVVSGQVIRAPKSGAWCPTSRCEGVFKCDN